jgi:hypothetical protein
MAAPEHCWPARHPLARSVVPWRATSAFRTHWRNVSGVAMPSFAAIDRIAAYSVSY